MNFVVHCDQNLDSIIKRTGIREKKKVELLKNLCGLLPKPILDHLWRVSAGCLRIARLHQIKMCQKELDLLQAAAYLHDIGKLFIDGAILNRTRRLSATEHMIVKHHTYIGQAILLTLGAENCIAETLLYHHENSNGSGYPTGISGNKIPVPSRIIHVMDVYDALTSDRPYRRAYTSSEAVAIMQNEQANFDLEVLDMLVYIISKGLLRQPGRK